MKNDLLEQSYRLSYPLTVLLTYLWSYSTNTASSGLVPYVGVCSTCWQSDLTIPFTIPSGPDSTSVPGVNDNSPISENTLVPSYFGSILPTCPNWVACASCSNGFSCTSATTTTDLTMSTASNTNDQISESSYTEIQTLAYAGYTTDLRSLSGSNPSTDADLPTSASSNPGLTVYLPVITSGTSRKSTDLPESLSKPPVVSRSSICLTISLPTSDIYGNIKTTLCLQGGPYTDSKISSSDIPNTTSLSLTVTSSSTESFSTNTPAESQLSSYGYISAPTTSITVTRNPTQSINPIFDNFEICPTCSAGFSCPSSTIPGTISLPSLSSVITTPASSRCDGWLPCDSCLSAYACPLVLSIPVLDYSSSSGVTTVYTCPGGHSTSTVSVKTLDGEIITCNNWQSCPTCDLSYTCLSASSTPLPSSTHLDGYYTLPEATKTGLLSPETTTQVPATPTCINYVICPTCVLGYVCLKTTPETYQLVTTTVATTPPSLIYYSVSDPISTITLPLPPICDSYTPCTTCIYGLTCAIPSTSSTSSLRTSISPSEQIKTITETMVYIYNTCGQPDLLTSFTVPTKILISTKNTCSPSTSTLTKKETCTSSVSYPNE